MRQLQPLAVFPPHAYQHTHTDTDAPEKHNTKYHWGARPGKDAQSARGGHQGKHNTASALPACSLMVLMQSARLFYTKHNNSPDNTLVGNIPTGNPLQILL